jgi:hypothetical protein
VSEHLPEALSLIETDVKFLQDAAQYIEELASKLDSKERAEWSLVAAIYRERAKLHEDMLHLVSSRGVS